MVLLVEFKVVWRGIDLNWLIHVLGMPNDQIESGSVRSISSSIMKMYFSPEEVKYMNAYKR